MCETAAIFWNIVLIQGYLIDILLHLFVIVHIVQYCFLE